MDKKESYPTTWEFPVKKALKLFLTVFLIGVISSYILTRFVNLDLLILNFHLQNLWITIPEFFIFFSGLYIWNWSRTSEKKKRQKQAKDQLNKLLLEAGGEQKK